MKAVRCQRKFGVATGTENVILGTDIAGMVAAITESELDTTSEKTSHCVLG